IAVAREPTLPVVEVNPVAAAGDIRGRGPTDARVQPRAKSSWPAKAGRISLGSVAPVEVSRLRPEVTFGLGRRMLFGLLAGPREHDGLRYNRRRLAVNRLLEARLVLGLEEGVVVERILGLVVPERHRVVEPGVSLLQIEMVLDHLGERRCC